jgi:hypothetical protein
MVIGPCALLIINAFSILVAIAALVFSMYSWREANRPFVSAHVSSHASGNFAIALDLIIENTGNQPAVDVRLTAQLADVQRVLPEHLNGAMPEDAQRCFFSDVTVPLLANGRTISNAFGCLAENSDATWQQGSQLPITITYKNLKGRRFKEKLTLLLADDTGFAQTSWVAH